MPALPAQPTPYPDVNALLELVLREVQTVLAGEFAGMYLHGSLATGDFDPLSSDIDVVVVTAGELEAELLPALAAMHARIAGSGLAWASHLECSYWPRAALRRYEPNRARHPEMGVDKPFAVRQQQPDWVIELHILRERGVVLAGPPPRALIDPISPGELKAAVCAILRGWWLDMLDEPDWFHAHIYQAFAVLTMCRALYTLRYGAVVSKPAAATWARRALAARWAPLIDRALAWRHDGGAGDPSEPLAFIRYAIEHSGRDENADRPR